MTTRRRGRWTYNSDSTMYGEAGWHLDGTPLVIDFMPGDHSCCSGGARCCRGCYLLYGWPGRTHEPLATHVEAAMEDVEREVDALRAAIAAGLPAGYWVSASHFGGLGWTWSAHAADGRHLGSDRTHYATCELAQAAGEAVVRTWGEDSHLASTVLGVLTP